MRWLLALILLGCASPKREPIARSKVEAPAPAPPPTIDELAAKISSGDAAQFLNESRGEIAFDYAGTIRERARDVAKVSQARVIVVALPSSVDPRPYGALHQKLSLAKDDVLFVFTANRRHLHCQAIPKSFGKNILASTNATFYKDPVLGALATLDEVGFYLHSRKDSVTL